MFTDLLFAFDEYLLSSSYVINQIVMSRNNAIVAILMVILIVFGLVIFSRQNMESLLSSEPSPTPSEIQNQMIVELNPVNINLYDQSGTATLVEKNNQVIITLALNQPSGINSSQPAHIHAGLCPRVGNILYLLNSVVNGKSTTTLNTTLSKLEDQKPLAINIHKSSSEINIYTTCGNLMN